nr:hypothetical protein [Tanacetum cinerariifolium]
MNYQPVTAGNQSNPSAGVQEQFDAEKAGEENVQQYVLFSLWSSGSRNPHNTDDDDSFEVKEPEFKGKKHESEVYVSLSSCAKTKKHNDKTTKESKGKSHVELSIGYSNLSAKFKDFSDNSINEVNAVSTSVSAVGQISTNNANTFSAVGPSNTVVSPTLKNSSYVNTSQYPGDPNMPELEDITYSNDEEDVGAEADFTNLETTITVSPILTTRVHKDHLVTQIIGDLSSATQTRSMKRVAKDQGGLSQINNEDFHICMFTCFLLQEEPKRVHQALKDPSWIEAMREELLQFNMQKVWVLVDFPNGKRAIGHTQEEGIDYEEVFAPVARIEAIRLFLAYASFMGFMMYQMDVKIAFLYETIEEEVYICQLLGFEDPDYPDKVYKVVNALYGLHQAPRVWYKTLANYLLENGFQRGKIDQTLFIKRQKGYILLVQIYVDDIIFGSTNKDLDPDGEDVDVHTYTSMIGSLMYLTSSRPDIMFAVYACARFQVTIKVSHLHAIKRILRYLKGKPHLGLWYPKDSPFNLVAYSNSDYAGASLDRKSTTGGCQFLRCRLISWKCKKQTVVATLSTEAELIVTAVSSKFLLFECSSCGALYTTDYYCFDGSLVDKIICDLNKTPNLFQEPPQNCPKCGNPVDGQYCQGCALLRKELKEVWFTYFIENGIFQGLLDTFESSNDNTNIVNASQEPFIVKQDPVKIPHKVLHISTTIVVTGVVLSLAWETILEIEHAFEDNHCQPKDILELLQRLHNDVQNIHEELAVYINTPSWDRPTIFYNNDDDDDCTIAITPILSTEEPDNSLNQFEEFSDSNDDSTSIDEDSFSIDDIKYVEASPPDSELIRLEVMEIVIPEVGGIDADILLTIKDDILRENLLNINLLIAKIKALKDNPTPYSDFMTKSPSTSLNFLLEETNTFDNSLPESETFCFDLEEISSGSTTTHADISILDYEAFYDDHVKEISSGSITTHFDFSLYDSFIFDLSINPFPPADRSDFYEFADELAHIISPSEYDFSLLRMNPTRGDFTMDVVEDTFPTREPRVHVPNVLTTHPTLQLKLDFILFSESLFAYVVWIFLPFLSYSAAP